MTLEFNLIPTIREPPQPSWDAEHQRHSHSTGQIAVLVKRPEADVD